MGVPEIENLIIKNEEDKNKAWIRGQLWAIMSKNRIQKPVTPMSASQTSRWPKRNQAEEIQYFTKLFQACFQQRWI